MTSPMPPMPSMTSKSGAAPTPPSASPMGDADDEGIGSKETGYAGPDMGPFSCANCMHFDGQGSCDNEKVMADPEVNGKVDAEGCCNLFKNGEGNASPDDGAAMKPETVGADHPLQMLRAKPRFGQ